MFKLKALMNLKSFKRADTLFIMRDDYFQLFS